ncbi:MAG: DUF3987 domain-containing protein [Proteobacteria bacterium]|nr:DUF3987 domain-containing protein [Pseudomonadota bacterium]
MRELSNWIDSYLLYMKNTESAICFHRWVALSVIASCLRKKVFLGIGRINIYSNMYVVFVGPPGEPRKSQAISFGTEFLSQIPDIVTSADSITPQALVEDLERCAIDEQMPDGSTYQHASLTITSKEFESFLGSKTENTKMITYLTDLFDAQKIPWKYRTKHAGTNVIPSVFLNLLAATTPESIASSLPSSAIGTGLTSRIMFIWADKRAKTVCYPEETPEEIVLKEKLLKDLYLISRMVGEFKFSSNCKKRFKEWYDNYDSSSRTRLCKDGAFTGWYARKPLYILKLAIIYSAATLNNMVVEWNHIKSAMKVIEDAEICMSNVFKAVGRSTIAADVDLVVEIVKARKWITEKQLLSLVWRDIDSNKLDNVLNTGIRSGKIRRSYEGPKGEIGNIWYRYAE